MRQMILSAISIHVNVECLYNLAIDYGYNNPSEQEEE